MLRDVWPFKRLRTYSSGAPVRANDLNALQDGIVHNKHGAIETPIPLGLAIPGEGWTYDGEGWVAPPNGGSLALPLAFSAGTDIVAITVWWHLQGRALLSAGASDYLFVHVTKRNPSNGAVTLERKSPDIKDNTVGEHANGRVTFTWSLDSDPLHLQPHYLYEIQIALGQSPRRLDGLAVGTARR